MKPILHLLFWGALLFSACADAPSAGEKQQAAAEDVLDKYYDRTLQVHDEIMPMMGELRRLERTLKMQADSLEGDVRLRYLQVVDSLAVSGDAMMDWMARFRPVEALRSEGLGDEQIKAMYKQQEEEIRQIGRRMEQALRDGRKLHTKGE